MTPLRVILRIVLVALGLTGWWFLPGTATADPPASERILDFHSLIVVHADSSMTVTETITVQSAQQKIKRGIYRDFPTAYRDRYGNTIRVGFNVRKALKNGVAEPFHIESIFKGKRVYFGSKEIILPPEVYTYAITYDTNRQLGYFKDFDELYWNVTGNGWVFPIDRAEAVVVLPPGATVSKYAAYTGPTGAKGQDFRASSDAAGNMVFATTRTLQSQEGLTIAVAWPKGHVAVPSDVEKMGYFLKDNLSGMLALLGLLVTSIYFTMVWHKVGRDPDPGTIIPLFSPPRGFSPPGVRYLMRMGYDQKTFAAAVVDLAVKGSLIIEEGKKGEYTLRSTGAMAPGLDAGERVLASKLFQHGSVLKLENTNHTRISSAKDALRKSLDKEINRIYFRTNRSFFIKGLVLSLLTLAAIILTSSNRLSLFPLIWFSGWSVGCCFLALVVYRHWQGAIRGSRFHFGKAFSALATTFFAIPFFIGEIVGGYFALTLSAPATLFFAILVFLNGLFYYLLKAPTLEGRRVMDQVEGFKTYLSVAEKNRLNILNPPEKTPQLFEKYLPYALALNVENQWSEQFTDVLARAQVDHKPYQPTWYSGRSWNNLGTSGFTDTLGGALASAIASSATAPGSSSGSGGGGSSGGGGGGGGGGGW